MEIDGLRGACEEDASRVARYVLAPRLWPEHGHIWRQPRFTRQVPHSLQQGDRAEDAEMAEAHPDVQFWREESLCGACEDYRSGRRPQTTELCGRGGFAYIQKVGKAGSLEEQIHCWDGGRGPLPCL